MITRGFCHPIGSLPYGNRAYVMPIKKNRQPGNERDVPPDIDLLDPFWMSCLFQSQKSPDRAKNTDRHADEEHIPPVVIGKYHTEDETDELA